MTRYAKNKNKCGLKSILPETKNTPQNATALATTSNFPHIQFNLCWVYWGQK